MNRPFIHQFQKDKVRILYPLLLCVSIAAVYSPTFSGDFILDDRLLVKDNLSIREFRSPASYLSHEDGINKEHFLDDHTGYYRPLVNFFYTLDYKIWGMRSLGFRVTNLILHVFTCLILYQVLAKFCGDGLIPFAGALLFGLHSVNTESVSWITARNNILVALFSLLSLYYYLKNRNERNLWARFFSYVSFAAALCSKEFAIMLLPIFFLCNRYIKNDRWMIRDEISGYVPFIIILFLYFILRGYATGSLLTPHSTPSFWKNIYFAPFIVLYNLKLILFPYGLHSFIVYYPKDTLSWKALAGFIGLGLLAFFLWRERRSKLVLFSFLSFLMALFPVLNIIPTSAVTLVSMRWLYFPMIFLSFSVVWYLEKALNRSRSIVFCVLVPVVAYLGTYSYVLNRNFWHDENTFYEQEVLHFGNSFYVGGFAESLFVKRKFIDAEKYFQIAINKYPHNARNYINYSALLIDMGRGDEALLYLDRAKSLRKTHFERGQWYNNQGMAYFQLEKRDIALTDFLKAVASWPYESQFWSNLGAAYGSIGDYRKSISSLKKGLENNPNSIEIRKNLAITYMKMEDYENAIIILEAISASERSSDIEIMALLRNVRQKLLPKGD